MNIRALRGERERERENTNLSDFFSFQTFTNQISKNKTNNI